MTAQPGSEAIRYDGVHCRLLAQMLPPSVVVLKISGSDVGEFGEAPMRALDQWLGSGPPVHFFIDAREGRGVSVDVSGDWARWLSRNRSKFRSVTMLTGSPFIQVTAEFVRRFSELQGVMRICTDPAVFDKALSEALT
jgi:hypothetical protein